MMKPKNMPLLQRRVFSWREVDTYIPALMWLGISLAYAFLCVAPFYAQWLYQQYTTDDISPLLASILGLLSVASVLFTPKNRRFSVGFFVGILWFYWIPLGMRYFDMDLFIPIVIMLEGIFVGLVFYIGLWCECLPIRFAFLLLLSFLMPLGFDWIVLESVFAYSYIGVDKLSFAFVILALWLLVKYQTWRKLIGILCLILACDWHGIMQDFSISMPLKIKLIQSDVKQDLSWRTEEMDFIFRKHIEDITGAIESGYDVVVLPESAFYVPLDSVYFTHLDTLLSLSKKIVIITGALRVEKSDDGSLSYFNSMLKIDNTNISFYDKVLLVPFGEYLPSFLESFMNVFFQGIGGFSAGKEFGYFHIKGVDFKNAICYEGTNGRFYEDNPPFVMMISNNAWFVPSIEPILQKNLLKYYARIHKSVIYHASNRSANAVITPNISPL